MLVIPVRGANAATRNLLYAQPYGQVPAALGHVNPETGKILTSFDDISCTREGCIDISGSMF
ncbi:hypothetical protein [Mesorhizobium sp. WSM3224]|uniref:hypothetical protein n=1 Tax=Mesorhizobium sp. WSM3224 TaxID=1040986 RepID=UPI0012EC70CE|nr:hypothetical protein [Mesorhizobium sp. WSM3224]